MAMAQCRQPIGERNWQSQSERKHEKGNADQTLAGPGQEPVKPRLEQALGALEIGQSARCTIAVKPSRGKERSASQAGNHGLWRP